jgi:hypothetical protein
MDRLTLLLVQYPMPQIATERLRAIEASGSPWRRGEQDPICDGERRHRRRGSETTQLGQLRSRGDVERAPMSVSKKDNIGNLLLAVFALIGILLLIGVAFGMFFGEFVFWSEVYCTDARCT